jgi:hydroxyacylglutathione hydrolase
MFERVKVVPINDHIWLLNDNNESTGYVIAGKDKALIIDTMNGYENVRAIAETLTDLPLTVVNTHGHGDHIYGNIYFDRAFLHPADFSIAEQCFSYAEFQKAVQKYGLKPAEMVPVHDGDVFDLGGIQLEVYETPGHTPGGICLLDRKDRILFSGDTVITQVWMQLPESLPLTTLVHSLDKLLALDGAFDKIFTGHSTEGPEPVSLCKAERDAAQEVYEGKTQNDEPYEWFGLVSKAHPYGDEKQWKVVYNG